MTLQETHRVVLFTGGILSLVVIPWAILARRRTFLKRADLRYDSLAIMWEKILYFKVYLISFVPSWLSRNPRYIHLSDTYTYTPTTNKQTYHIRRPSMPSWASFSSLVRSID